MMYCFGDVCGGFYVGLFGAWAFWLFLFAGFNLIVAAWLDCWCCLWLYFNSVVV